MKLDTVNVIINENDEFQAIYSFSDNEGGNLQAEEAFRKELIKRDCPECDIDSYVEDGYFEKGGDKIWLVHTVD